MSLQKTALVTGASGFIGSHLVDKLIELKFKVRVLARKESNLRWLNKNDNVEIVSVDYSDLDGLKNIVKDVNFIFHIGGVIKAKSKETYFKGNVETTKNLLQAVKQSNPKLERFVLLSSQACAGPSELDKPKTEEMNFNPVTTYGKSKMFAELEVRKYKGLIPFTIIRPSAVYGPRDPEILIFFKSIYSGIQPLIGFSDKYVSLIYIEDLIEGIILSIQSEKSIDQTYFISSERGYSWREIGDITASIVNKRTIKIRIPHFLVYVVAAISQFASYFREDATILNLEKAREMVQKSWICSVEKAKSQLGYTQKVSLEEGIRLTLDWYKKQNWL